MQSRHSGILRSVNRDSHYNILTAPTHEAYQSNMANLPHMFYMLQEPGNTKPWNHWSRPVPRNHILLNGSNDQIKPDMIFDLVLSQNKFGQFQLLSQYANNFNIPLLSLEHTWPHPQWSKQQLDQTKAMKGDLNLFISESSCRAWGWDPDDDGTEVIRHGVDTNLFTPTNNWEPDGKILTVANDYIARSWCLGFDIYQRVTYGLPTNPVGDTKGFSQPSKNQYDLVDKYQKASVFLNTSTYSPIPMSLLEAASCAVPVVSNDTCACGELIEHGVNGFITKNETEMRDALIWCLQNPDQARQMGLKARETVLDKFSLTKHLQQWQDVFLRTHGSIRNQWR